MPLRVWLPLNGDLRNNGLSDVTITNNNATVNTAGKIGSCYSFNGSANLSATGYTDFGNNYTVSLWFYCTSISSNRAFMCTRNATGAGFSLFLISGKLRIDSGIVNSTATQWTTNYTAPLNTWHHLTIIRNGGDVSYYVDGVFQEVKTITYSGNYGNVITIGCSQANGSTIGNYFAGRMNDVRIYDHALSPKEIKLISQGLVAHYQLNAINDTMLPYGYQRLTYINNTSSSCFDTGYYFNPETDYCKIEFQSNTKSQNGMLLGNNNTKYFWAYYYSNATSSVRIYAHNGTAQQNIYLATSDLNRHVLEYGDKHGYFDGVDCGSLTNTYTEQLGTSWMFSYNASSYKFNGKIFYAEIRRNGVAQRIFIPAKRIHDSAVGMYDLVTNEFFVSASSTAFIAGDIVETSSTVYDVSGYGYNGTNYDAVSSFDSPRGLSSMEFNGSSNYIEFPNLSFMPNMLPNEWTFSFWVYNQDSGDRSILFSDYAIDITGSAFCFEKTTGELLRIGYSGSFDRNIPNSTLTVNAWTHIAVTKTTANLITVYRNGIQIDSYTNANCKSDGVKYRMGRDSRTGSTMFKGKLSDFRIYSTALSADDVKTLYNAPVSITNKGAMITQGEFNEHTNI